MKNLKFCFQIFCLLSIVFFFSCSGKKKEREKIVADSLAHVKVIADSLKKIEEANPKFLVIRGSNVNLRVDPTLDALRIRQFKTGDTCEIIEKGKKDTVNDVIDFWYKVKRNSKEGWIFGEYTSLKLIKEKK
jgi:SH3-like domain-containing protein